MSNDPRARGRSRRVSRVKHDVGDDGRYTSGPYVGEPAVDNRRAPTIEGELARGRKEAPIPMARMAIARADAMGEPRPAWAVKFIAAEEVDQVPAGEVPPPPSVGGSILPEIVASRQIPNHADQWTGLVKAGEVVDPPFSPWLLVSTVLESGILPPAVEAMATNIGGYGYELEPLFETEDPETGAKLDLPPEAQAEEAQVELFLATASLDLGFEGVTYQVDHDTESIGWGALEILRNRLGEPAAWEHVPAYTLRCGKLSGPILVETPVRHPKTNELLLVPRYRRFRAYVQIRENRTTYFKSFGDPRYMNRKTGQTRTTSWGNDEEGQALDATEVYYFRQYASWTPYGVPRWVGALPQVRAARQTGELLADWFDNAPIGTKLITVAGGAWSQESLDQALGVVDDMARGIENAWSFVTLEAEPRSFQSDPLDATKEQRPQVQIEDLAVKLPPELYQGSDSLWNLARSHVASMFRLPPIYFGQSDDYTRATSATARAVTEEQVFVPERRRRWGVFLNQVLLPSLGVNHWKVKLRGANTSDDTDLPIAELAAGGGVSPNALIRKANEVLGQDREPIQEPWGDRPLVLTLELLKAKIDPNVPLDEAFEEIKAQEEEAKAEAKAQLAALNGGPSGEDGPPSPEDGDDDGPPPKDEVAKSIGTLERLVALRHVLARELEAKAAALPEDPPGARA